MQIEILTIFPGYFESPLRESLLGKGIAAGLLEVVVTDLRQFATDRHHKVDDEPYGGGPGMVMMAPVVAAAIEAVRGLPGLPPAKVYCLAPDGRRFDHAFAAEIAALERCVLVCGRYEGIDQRVADAGLYDGEISLGDFVLSGGEIAALAVIEASARLAPGFVKEIASVENDSFYRGLLDHPHYTRPREWRGLAVPEVLLSGHHEKIESWRREEAERRTRARRPDLLGRR